jgi:hypothetical protein
MFGFAACRGCCANEAELKKSPAQAAASAAVARNFNGFMAPSRILAFRVERKSREEEAALCDPKATARSDIGSAS